MATAPASWLRRAQAREANRLDHLGRVLIEERGAEAFNAASGAIEEADRTTIFDGPGLVGSIPRTSDNDTEVGAEARHRTLRRLRIPAGGDGDNVDLGHVVTVLESIDDRLVGETFVVTDVVTTGVRVTRILTMERWDRTSRR